jgi:heme/copper-type cytochrome/quinol oxidase subunit 2
MQFFVSSDATGVDSMTPEHMWRFEAHDLLAASSVIVALNSPASGTQGVTSTSTAAPSQSSGVSIGLIIGIVVAVLVVLIIVIIIVAVVVKRKNSSDDHNYHLSK